MKKFGLSQYTLDAFFERVIEKYPTRPSLALVGEKPFTYSEFGAKVYSLKETLKQIGIKKGDKIILLGNSSPNWSIAFMAITTMGAVAVPILEEFPEADIDHIIRHSEAVGIFISENLYNNLNLNSLSELKSIIKLNDFTTLSEITKNKTNLWKQILDLPGKIIKSLDKSVSDNSGEKINEDDLAEILYTSGTTGHSKGVMLTHKNLVSNLFEGPDLLGVINEESVVLSILPLAHAFGSTSAFLSIIRCGSSIYYLQKPPSPKILLDAMQIVQPTIMGAVPLVFEKIYHKQVVPTIARSKALRLLSKTGLTKKVLYKIIGKKVKKLLGGRLECVIIGGASFSPEVETFMKEGGIPYCCGYGLSECSPLVTFSSMKTQKMGSTGHAISDVSIKIVNPDPNSGIGEICIKGPNVMKGYYKDEELTRKSFTNDGWFITGDQGYLDKDGFIFITGRSKNVIVGPSGENIYPEVIESKLEESIFVEETIVYQADKQLIARVYPNYSYIDTLKTAKDDSSIASDIINILENLRSEVNAKLPNFSKISKIVEQISPFIKTPTNKIKRAEYIEGYTEKA
ncbi:MAG: AMP-forming long-chain acyl-CoA synthetase [Ignavibacteriales bacterium]|nr:MAG: AMP-forming long-chain acyl-CoA synthetase [Ignavibacteriales bacterium]